MKQLLYTETGRYESHIAADSLAIPFLEEIVNMYNALRLPATGNGSPQALPVLEPGELYLLIKDPQSLIFDKMTGGQAVSIAGLQVDKHKAIEILTKPEGYDELVAQIEYGKQSDDFRNGGNYPALHASQIQPRYDIDEDGEVVIKEDYREKVEEQYKHYLTTDFGAAFKEWAADVVEQFNQQGFAAKLNITGESNFFKDIFQKGESGMELNLKGFTQFNNERYANWQAPTNIMSESNGDMNESDELV